MANQQHNVVLRGLQPGDIGWVVQQHGEIYWCEYGWNNEFEAKVADIAAKLIRNFKPEWERCWIAEQNGQRVGSAFVVRKSKNVAQLRMLIVTPQARGIYSKRGFTLTKSESYTGFGQSLVGEFWELRL